MTNVPITPGSGIFVRTIALSDGSEAQMVFSAPYGRIPVNATLTNSQVTVSSSSVLLNTYKPTGATHAEIAVDGADIRWWDDNKTPTATEGKPLKQGNYLWVEAPSTFKMIAQSGSATVTISWYKYE